jgi:hypothetical protein
LARSNVSEASLLGDRRATLEGSSTSCRLAACIRSAEQGVRLANAVADMAIPSRISVGGVGGSLTDRPGPGRPLTWAEAGEPPRRRLLTSRPARTSAHGRTSTA